MQSVSRFRLDVTINPSYAWERPIFSWRRPMQRFVSSILIIAVLLCTFSCTSGRCCAVDLPAEAIAQSAKSCCKHCQRDPQPSDQRPERSKSETPSSSHEEPDADCCSCQGACSGMVRSKPIELKATSGAMLVSLTAHFQMFGGSAVVVLRASADDLPNRETSHGLSMRIRVCSLTC